MAYAFAVSDPLIQQINGVRHVSWLITETDVSPSSEWTLEAPQFCTLTLLEAGLTDADAATTIQPELGKVAGWTVDRVEEHVDQLSTAAAYLQSADRRVMVLPNGRLYGRSKPDAHANEIKTRISVVVGHP